MGLIDYFLLQIEYGMNTSNLILMDRAKRHIHYSIVMIHLHLLPALSIIR